MIKKLLKLSPFVLAYGAYAAQITIPGEFIVGLRSDLMLNRVGLEKIESLSKDSRLVLAKVKNTALFLANRSFAKSSEAGIQFIEPNFVIQNYKPVDMIAPLALSDLFSQQWSLENMGQLDPAKRPGKIDADIDATEAWQRQSNASGVEVAVIDSGIEATHEDLSTYSSGLNFADKDESVGADVDENGHGTHVSGIIAASHKNSTGIRGVADSANLKSLKVFDSTGSGTLAGLLKALESSIEKKDKIVNMSLGSSVYSEALYQTMKRAGDAGVLFVVAAGNSGADLDDEPVFPAAFALPNQITVASTNNIDHISSFSSYSTRYVDLAAPGEYILSTYKDNSYKSLSGTSMAAPHVSGAVALLLAKEPTLSPSQIKERVLASAEPIAGLEAYTATGGRLNVDKLLGL